MQGDQYEVGDALWTVTHETEYDVFIIVSWPEGSWDYLRRGIGDFRRMVERRLHNSTRNTTMPRPTLDEVMTACEADDNLGFCLDCGEEHSGIEPDARRYKCELCGELRVYGAEEILLMGVCDEDDE